jgi:hypothetical protein
VWNHTVSTEYNTEEKYMWRFPVVQTLLLRRGLLLEYLTLGWNVVGVVIVLTAAYNARSVALAGFGLDSLIEIFALIIVVWQLLVLLR